MQRSARLQLVGPVALFCAVLAAEAAAYALAGNTAEAQRTLAELKATAPHLSPERMANRPPPFDKMQPELVRGLRLALTPKT